MSYYSIITHDDYLAHHGILGQKWGVRRYQNADGSLTNEGKRRYLKYTSPTIEKTKSILKRIPRRLAAELIPGYGELQTVVSLSKFSKYLINGYDSKDYTKKEGEYEKISELKKMSTPSLSPENEVKKTNPRLGMQKGKVNNCGYCAITMEMRRRGYDVIARSKSQGIVDNDLHRWFKNLEINTVKASKETDTGSRKKILTNTYNKLCDEIESLGEGSRGYLAITYEGMNCGHAMFWEVSNGNAIIYDGQSGKYGHQNDKLISLSNPYVGFRYARLDNLKMNPEITEVCRSNK